MKGKKLPVKHLSIRVPWHDNGWNGTVCKKPKENASCLFLPNIYKNKNTDLEKPCEKIWELPDSQFLPCIAESAAFMCAHEITRTVSHPYSDNHAYQHFLPTKFGIPPYSFVAIPFRWTMKNSKDKNSEIADELNLDYNPVLEPDLGFETMWIQDSQNQKILLDTFFSVVVPNKSLCFIYAKHVPLTDKADRVLVGVGRVKRILSQKEYNYSKKGETRSLIWETIIQHTIRENFADGFLLPYHELLEKAKGDPSINLDYLVAVAPNREEFLYRTEHVSHGTAIDSLLSLAGSLKRSGPILMLNYNKQLRWIDDRLSELWRLRGPYPGLGPVLTAFGIEGGNFVVWEIAKRIEKENKNVLEVDPWTIVDKMFHNPNSVLPAEYALKIGPVLKRTWGELSNDRKNYLKLLSRMEINNEQAKRFYDEDERKENNIDCLDSELLKNPYLFYEFDRSSNDPIAFYVVDKGMFPVEIIREKFPLSEASSISEAVDHRRVRAATIHVLEESSQEQGHSLLPSKYTTKRIADMELQPSCPVTNDIMKAIEPSFANTVLIHEHNQQKYYQLRRLHSMKEIIYDFVVKRSTGKKHKIKADWKQSLDKMLGPVKAEDKDENKARQEKTTALVELAKSRFAVLIGAAGTGKTTLLSVLCNQEEIRKQGVLLLAPTGKARVRMLQKIGLDFKSQTIAQFLLQLDRYNEEIGEYHLSSSGKYDAEKTVIVDEASMLTVEQLGALIDSLKGVERFILIGDYRQLPPIGTGRPFIDIVNYLKPNKIESIFPKTGSSYAELTVMRRQVIEGSEIPEDLQLANWFSGAPLSPGEDNIFYLISKQKQFDRLEVTEWFDADDLHEKLLKKVVSELKLRSVQDEIGFGLSLGGTQSGEYVYFNIKSAESVEKWQMLSPVKGHGFGIKELNRLIQRTFRKSAIELAESFQRKRIPKPMGPDRIVYGDKVINVRNHRRQKIFPKEKKGEALRYIANGEIGIACGMFRKKEQKWSGELPLNVSFSSQPGYCYYFLPGDFKADGDVYLELAYGITIHKSQGSDFDLTLLILPNPCLLLSRELLYTALTRQRNKIVIFHQGDIKDFKRYSSDEFSEISKRITNLFSPPSLKEFKNTFYDENLIHTTKNGEFVRSKSEVIIADNLLENNIDYSYERILIGKDGSERYPDFTITDENTGLTYYWEHLGMFNLVSYRKKWDEKLKWYKVQNILPYKDGGGENGTLIISREAPDGGINSQEINRMIKKIILRK